MQIADFRFKFQCEINNLKSAIFIALASGIFMGLTVAPVNAWPLAWVALAPLWIAISSQAADDRNRESFSPAHLLTRSPVHLLGLVWGIGYHGLALFWITGVHPMTWMGVPWLASLAIAIFCWVFITLWGAAIVALWSVGMRIVNFRLQIADFRFKELNLPSKICHLKLFRVLIGTALWCVLEALWSAGPLWWTSLSYTQSPHNLAILHLSQLSGPITVTAAIVAVNGLIAEAWIDLKTQTKENEKNNLFFLFLPLIVCCSLHLLGFGLYSRPLVQPAAAALKVGIIQGNIPNQLKLYPEGWRRAIEGYTAGYRTLASQGVDAVLTPETALPFLWSEPNQIQGSFYPAILDKGVVAWVGAFGKQGLSLTNSLLTVTGTGEIFSRYNKVKLVPLGEYIPFEDVLGKFIDRLSPLDAHLVAGKPRQVFETPFGRAIVGICYESAFAEHFRRQAAAGGQFILSPSNDAHYSPSMPAQHHAQDVMRAIETDRWSVRATNTGYSAIVDPHGRTEWISQLNTYELHAATIYRRQTQTLYVSWGNWLTPLLLILAMMSGIWIYLRAGTSD